MIDPEELAEAFKQAIMESGIRERPENHDKGMEWLKYAADDFDSSRLLHGSGMYRTSVIQLQQASEKACKSLLLLIGLCDEKDLEGFRHRSDEMSKGVQKKASHLLQFLDHFDPGAGGTGRDAIAVTERKIRDVAFAPANLIIELITQSEQYAGDLVKTIERDLKKAQRAGAKMAIQKEGDSALIVDLNPGNWLEIIQQNPPRCRLESP